MFVAPAAAAAERIVLLRRKLVCITSARPATPFLNAICGIAEMTLPKSATTLPSASVVERLGLTVS